MASPTSSPSSRRDLSLAVLALIVAVCAMVCGTVLALEDKISGDLAAGVLGTAGGSLAAFAIGRMSGANGERAEDAAAPAATPPLPSRPPS